jgi:hypothetical protein
LSKLYLKGANKHINSSLLQKLSTVYNEDFYLDILDFENILAGANEFSNLGRILGINQGVATTKENLTKFKNFIE